MQLVVDSTECQKYAQKEKLDLLRSSDTTLCYSLGNNNILEFTEEEKLLIHVSSLFFLHHSVSSSFCQSAQRAPLLVFLRFRLSLALGAADNDGLHDGNVWD